MRRHSRLLWAVVLLAVAIQSHTRPVGTAEPVGSPDRFGRLPLRFEVNSGQTDPSVRFLARGDGYGLFLTPTEAVLSLRAPARRDRATSDRHSAVVRMRLAGAQERPQVTGLDRQPDTSHYFIGNDPEQWRRDVASYAKVKYAEVYPGIDLIYYGKGRPLEYDFVVAPGADPGVIAFTFDGARNITADATGNLVLTTTDGELQLQKPTIYQIAGGVRREVAGRFDLQTSGTVRFDLAAYDHTVPLIIDPVLVYSTYLGGTGQDVGNGIVVDAAGSAYVVADAGSATFPTVNSNQIFSPTADVVISKFNADGSALVYSTFLGGSTGSEHGWDIAVDGGGNAYVTGTTVAANFPTTANALQPTKLTGSNQDTAFVTKLAADGTLAYSTYLSGSQSTRGFGIATDGAGNAYVTGQAGVGFPLTPSAFSSTSTGAGFLTKLDTAASGAASLVYSTFLGPTGFAEGRAIAVDANGNAYIAGHTNATSTNFTSPGAFQTTIGPLTHAFVAKFDTNLSGAASRVYSTYLGGNGQDYAGSAVARGSKAIAIDASGHAYVTGQTTSTNFPVVNAFQPTFAGFVDGFLTKLDPTGSSLIYSTYLGGSHASVADESPAVAVNAAGQAYVTGHTESTNFPLSSNFTIPGSTTGGLFVTKFTPAGNAVVYSVRMGRAGVSFDESGRGIALDRAGNAFVTGFARVEFPQVNPLQGFAGGNLDAFLSRIADPTIIGCVTRGRRPIAGATVTLTGGGTQTTTTDANGCFTFGLLTVGGSYSVSAVSATRTFAAQAVTNLQQNVRLDFTLRGNPEPDFDGDGKSDLSFVRPSTSQWWVRRSSDNAVSSIQAGILGDVMAPADYDGDGKTDIALYRAGAWAIVSSGTGEVSRPSLGAAGDLPMAADYDGDGLADVSVYRPSTGEWFRRNSSTGQSVSFVFGVGGDIPLIGDFDGDGKSDLAVFRPSGGTWYTLRSSDGVLRAVSFGVSTDIPVPADYTGDGKTDVAVFRPGDGTWYILRSEDSSFYSTPFGANGDLPVAADYNGDGKAELGVFRSDGGTWFIQVDANTFQAQAFGAPGDLPVPLFFTRQQATALPPPAMSLDRTSLNFAATSTGTAFISQTSPQTVRLTQATAGNVTWTATSNQPWLSVSPASGTGSATLTIGVSFTNSVAAAGTASGAITLAVTGAANTPGPVTVSLHTIASGTGTAPTGAFDTPTDGATGVIGSTAVTGWAIDDVEVTAVRILRDPVIGEGTELVFVANAGFVDGARVDIQTGNPGAPRNTRAGWGYLMLTNFLPYEGNGTFKFYAYADDADGHSTLLGTKTITCANATATTPFGAIDTPGQGATVSGVINNFGWVLARGPALAYPPFGTVRVLVDGAFLPGAPGGWASRPDLAALFHATRYPGITNALGVASLDTTTLSNGVHTIAWLVTADNGEAAGIGSRYFTVANGSSMRLGSSAVALTETAAAGHHGVSAVDVGTLPIERTPIAGRRGFDPKAPLQPHGIDANGRTTIHGEELDRFELRFEDGSRYAGYRRVGDELWPLPAGARLDEAAGLFTWAPGVGFVHDYHLVFIRSREGRPIARREVTFVLHPKGSNCVGPQVTIDTPSANAAAAAGRSLLVAGWAIDLDDPAGTGVDAVHVWAYPAGGMYPIFLGAASYGGARPDVAAIFGDRFAKSGYGLAVESLSPGTYDLAVFAWSTPRNGFVPARVVRVTVQ